MRFGNKHIDSVKFQQMDCKNRLNALTLQSVMEYGFDNEKYLKIQSEHIKERISKFGNKLYLELGRQTV